MEPAILHGGAVLQWLDALHQLMPVVDAVLFRYSLDGIWVEIITNEDDVFHLAAEFLQGFFPELASVDVGDDEIFVVHSIIVVWFLLFIQWPLPCAACRFLGAFCPCRMTWVRSLESSLPAGEGAVAAVDVRRWPCRVSPVAVCCKDSKTLSFNVC